MKKEYNIAYIDAQNLHLGTISAGWYIDDKKFRVYLKDKFNVREAYYFLGYFNDQEQALYTSLQKAGFILVFREHSSHMKGKKKGNVDVDICFEMMKSICEGNMFNYIVLVTGDGDYIKPVNYLIQKGKFKKILFPNKKYSSLYRNIQDFYGMNLSAMDVKSKILYNKKKETP